MPDEPSNDPNSAPETSEQEPTEARTGDQSSPDPTAQTDQQPQQPGQLRGDGLNKVIDDPDAPSWARGRTVSDLIQNTQSLIDSIGSGDVQGASPQTNQSGQNVGAQRQQWQQAQQSVQQNAPSAQQPTQQPSVNPPHPDLYYENEQEYYRRLNEWQKQATQQQVQQLGQPVLQQNAQTARELSKRDPKLSDVWERYEPEVMKYIQNVPVQNRTKDAWDMAAKLVKADHMDEMVAQQAERQRSRSGSAPVTGRPSGSPDTGREPVYNDAIEKFYDSDHPYVKRCREQGITEAKLRERAAAMGLGPEEFVENITGQNLITSPTGITQEAPSG